MSAPGDDERRRYMAKLAELREAGAIGADDELELIRHYHATCASLAAALNRLMPEYERRREREGETRALEWLAREAEEVGRREGRAARRVLDALHVDGEVPAGT